MYNEQVIFPNPNMPLRIVDHSGLAKIGALCKMHFHTELEFLMINSGSTICRTDEGEYVGNAGELIFINSRVPHMTEVLADGTNNTLIQFRSPSPVQNSAMRYMMRYLRSNDIGCHVFKKDDPDLDEAVSIVNDMRRENREKSNAFEYYLMADIYRMIALLHRKGLMADGSAPDIKAMEKIVPVIEFIDSNYTEHLELETFSRVLNLNEYYFCRLFKKATGSTVTDYLNFVRICKAEKLLKTDMSISEISFNVGFSSLSYFNRIFKKYKFCSPTEYRKISGRIDGLILGS